jgi:uncharacterized repeat protein (TIGR01451 family)
LTLDAATNTIYAIDGGGKQGIFILHFLPDGDTGQGLLDTVNTEILGAACGIAVSSPNATSLGPDGNLYVGFKRSGNIMRVIAPLAQPLPCANVQPAVIATGDRLTSQMAWVGHTLFGNTSRLPFEVTNADQCLTPLNGNLPCGAGPFSFPILVSQTTVVSDQAAGQLDGNNLYFGAITNVAAVTNITGPSTLTQNPYGTQFFSFVSALAVDASDPANSVLYVGDDPSNGVGVAQGRWWQILATPPPPAPPSAPLNATATAGDAQATVNWNAPVNHQPVTSYTVHNLFAGNGLTVPDVVVTPPANSTVVPTGATVKGLTNGVAYQFEVQASNAQGSGPFSTPTNTVTPQAVTVPGAPTNVVASAGNAAANVAWTAPASNGGSPITGYTVTALSGGVATGIVATAPGSVTGVTVAGLTNGSSYTFAVHATNAIGNGPESAPSAPVTPTAVTVPDAPVGVGAAAGDSQATVAWFAPVNNGGSPITSYTVTTLVGGVPTGAPVSVAGTSATILGLTNGTAYTFTVHATNAVGNGPESFPSAPVIPAPPSPDLAITMSGPSSVVAGGNAVYSLKVSNLGPTTAAAVTVSDSETGASVSSVTTTQGACTIVATAITCNLGQMTSGGSAVITVTLKPASQTTNTATVQLGGTQVDPNQANNSASVTTTVIPLAATTDVQVVGSAQNGGPAVTASDIFTWQIKNNQSLAANAVHFSSSLAPGMVFQSVSSSLGSCTAPPAGTAGATLTCDVASLAGGQAMIVTVTVTFNATGSMTTTGQASFDGTDNNPANNQSSIVVGVK